MSDPLSSEFVVAEPDPAVGVDDIDFGDPDELAGIDILGQPVLMLASNIRSVGASSASLTRNVNVRTRSCRPAHTP